MPVTIANITAVFARRAPTTAQEQPLENIRVAAEQFARAILQNTPACADQTVAVRCVRDAVMNATAAVLTEGLV